MVTGGAVETGIEDDEFHAASRMGVTRLASIGLVDGR
jgi:hypothetical protein